MTRLYVIGNGFDLHHGIRSGYRDFAKFVETTEPDTYERAETFLFGEDGDLWGDFENNLQNLDTDAILDQVQTYLTSHGSDDWRDSDNHTYPEAIDEIVSALSFGLHELFVQWLGKLEIPTSIASPVNIDPAARFINFNYTPTLQSAYAVPDAQILHIHGQLGGAAKDIILGHGWEAPKTAPAPPASDEDLDDFGYADDDLDDRDTRVIQGERTINRYFKDTFKPTRRILRRNQAFFETLSTVTEVWVMGHSVSAVDLSYFRHILAHVSPSALWKVSFHSGAAALKSQLKAIGLARPKVRFLKIHQF
jgi:hypothetical protein